MVSVYALLCAAALLRSDCTPATAIDVVRMPDAESGTSCLRHAMLTVAQLAVQPAAGEYWEIVCSDAGSAPNFAVSPPEVPPSMGEPPLRSTSAAPRGSH
jgi:hypothetical protein